MTEFAQVLINIERIDYQNINFFYYLNRIIESEDRYCILKIMSKFIEYTNSYYYDKHHFFIRNFPEEMIHIVYQKQSIEKLKKIYRDYEGHHIEKDELCEELSDWILAVPAQA